VHLKSSHNYILAQKGAFGNMIPKYLTVGTEAGNSRRVEIPKGNTITRAALERALSEIHPDRETALELVRIRIFRLCAWGGRSAWPRTCGAPAKHQC